MTDRERDVLERVSAAPWACDIEKRDRGWSVPTAQRHDADQALSPVEHDHT